MSESLVCREVIYILSQSYERNPIITNWTDSRARHHQGRGDDNDRKRDLETRCYSVPQPSTHCRLRRSIFTVCQALLLQVGEILDEITRDYRDYRWILMIFLFVFGSWAANPVQITFCNKRISTICSGLSYFVKMQDIAWEVKLNCYVETISAWDCQDIGHKP